MKVLAAVKRVVDYNARIRTLPDGSGVDISQVKMSMNPFDEIAVEQAVRLKEAGVALEVVLVSVGCAKSQEVLRHGFALGADRGILVKAETDEPLNIAKILAKVAKNEQADLILLGKQAIDNDANQVGQMLSALLGWPQATFVSELNIEQNTVQATSEVDGGLMTQEMSLPAVITTDLRLNEPRYASLPNIMKAKSKKIDTCSLDELGVEIKAHTRIDHVADPEKRQAGVKLDSAKDLVDALKQQGVLS